MVPKSVFIENLLIADYHIRKNGLRDGCYVECGTWAGGLSFAFLNLLYGIREWHFFDSFEGLPPAQPLDGELAINLQKSGELSHDNNVADYDTFKENLEISNPDGKPVFVHKGWFDETLPTFQSAAPIAVLRLDGDWYDSTRTCLEHLFDKVQPGGLILIDDYYAWDGCSRAVHDFLSQRKATEKLQESKSRVAYIIKHD
jgi:hypothetical protein